MKLKLRIKITGANGYIGSLISRELKGLGHEVSGINRKLLYGPVEHLLDEIRGSDVIINLAGVSILKRWTRKSKNLIYDSRIQTSTNLVKAINLLSEKERPGKFISASAIGIYKSDLLHDETSTNYDTGFLGKVVKEWEDSLNQLPETTQKSIFRIGLVLGKNAKTIKNLLLPFKLGLGGKIGTGKQAFPFIHEKDVLRAIVWAVEENNRGGVFNLVAPEKITNADFTKALAKKLHRPAILPVPAFILKMVLGKAASLLLESPVVESKALLDIGFGFEYQTIDLTLDDIMSIV